MSIPDLETMGPRLMICGPSSNGKSTLALAIARKTGWPVVHLDQLRHLPGTDWVQRPDDDFAALHAEAIQGNSWVIEGNYSKLMPPRLARASGIILLGANRWANLWRYVQRTLFDRQRVGSLDGLEKERLKWSMIHWILVISPQNLAQYRERLPQAGLPVVEIRNMRELKALYAAWGLSRTPR
jgi:adenylate kinase family enzyme